MKGKNVAELKKAKKQNERQKISRVNEKEKTEWTEKLRQNIKKKNRKC